HLSLSQFVPSRETRERIEAALGRLIPSPSTNPADESRNYRFENGQGVVGFISPVSEPYCGTCNRMRLTADGRFHLCLLNGDERAVPPTDPASNYRMAREALLDRVGVSRERVHRMEADDPDLEAAAARYGARLPERLDVLVLGMGPDGHTASLFPHSAALRETERKVVAAQSPVPPLRRLTITPPVIAAARRVAVISAGASKAPIVARVLRGAWCPEELPA